jgi:hypothetical protein
MAKTISAKRWAKAIQKAAVKIGYPPRGPRGSKVNIERRQRAAHLVAEAREMIRDKVV